VASVQRILRGALLALLVPLAAPVRAETPPPKAPSDAEVRELTQRLDALKKQLGQLEEAKDESARQSLMQENWRAMQDYMGWMHGRWGAGAPWMMNPDERGGPGASACPMLGGSGAAWPLPGGVTPKQYGEQMRAPMQTMSEQMARIAQATDPQERARLLQEHWQTMYRDMQDLRGLGWMWGGPMRGPGTMGSAPAKPLPDPDSAGAKLVANYCTQCHAAPDPTLHTAQEWTNTVNRMHLRTEGRGTVVKTPSEDEWKTILAYMKQHAR
jgi:hypothetical protein